MPVDSLATGKRMDFWEYLLSIDPLNEWEKHAVYIYRDQPAPRFQATKCGRMLRFSDGQEIPIFDQQEIEGNLQRRCGRGKYQFIVKRGPSINANLWLEIGGHPSRSQDEVLAAFDRPPQPNGNGTATPVPISTPYSSDATAIASKAIDTVANADAAQTRITIDALSAAASIVRAQANPPQDTLTQQFMAAAMQRMLAPPPDPFEQFAKFLTMMQTINGATSAGGDPIVKQIMETGLKRLLEPAPASGPAISAGAELVRSLPAVGVQIVEGMREWRMGMEAQERGVSAMRTAGAPPSVAPGAPGAPPAHVLPPASNPAPNGAPNMNAAPSLEFIESRIVELLRQPVSAEEAADHALEFLHMCQGENPPPDQQFVQRLTSLGETGLLQLFNFRPILKQATTNTPRLLEFIRAFLKLHAEDEQKASEEAKANEHKPN